MVANATYIADKEVIPTNLELDSAVSDYQALAHLRDVVKRMSGHFGIEIIAGVYRNVRHPHQLVLGITGAISDDQLHILVRLVERTDRKFSFSYLEREQSSTLFRWPDLEPLGCTYDFDPDADTAPRSVQGRELTEAEQVIIDRLNRAGGQD